MSQQWRTASQGSAKKKENQHETETQPRRLGNAIDREVVLCCARCGFHRLLRCRSFECQATAAIRSRENAARAWPLPRPASWHLRRLSYPERRQGTAG